MHWSVCAPTTTSRPTPRPDSTDSRVGVLERVAVALLDQRLGVSGSQLRHDPPRVAPRTSTVVGVLHPDDRDILSPRLLDQAADIRDNRVALGRPRRRRSGRRSRGVRVRPVLECGHGLPFPRLLTDKRRPTNLEASPRARARRRAPRGAIIPGRRGRRPAGSSPTSSEPVTSAPRVCASDAIRSTMSCSGAACQSSTFIETWTRPAVGRSSPSARTPGKPPPRSRTTPAISRATSSEPRRFTLNAISGCRAPRMTPPADSCSRTGPKSGASSPASTRAWSPAAPPRRRRPGRARAARRRRPAAPIPRRCARRPREPPRAPGRSPRGRAG